MGLPLNMKKIKGISGTKPGKLLKKYIPVRTYYPWNERKPGFFEIDTVHHCEERDSGEFADLWSDLTLTATDVFYQSFPPVLV